MKTTTTVLRCVLVMLAGVACTVPNPAVCCENERECADIGVSDLRPCSTGSCVGHSCVAMGSCDGPEDCDEAATCTGGSCVSPMNDAGIDSPATCVTDREPQCRQVLASLCAYDLRCYGQSGLENCQYNVDHVCPPANFAFKEQTCVTCRAVFTNGVCGDDITPEFQNCLDCYGLAWTNYARCPCPAGCL